MTVRERAIGKNKIDNVIKAVKELNPEAEVERIDDFTVIINDFRIRCNNFED